MGPVSGVVTYLCIWWTLLFCTLSIGVQTEGTNETGNLPAAPKIPNLKYKFFLTTIISALAWLMIYILIQMEVVNFHQIAADMSASDRE